ncbi:putative 18S rRNA (guanine-N(7))-methyltransferase isoform X1 [Temnothorax americanus]|uniref:putative 18S rRNA (guanine-N(7))-methyltransferase isoform X1 n=1 Tax=Temnothorax americanus TaxID=1964332 RepID=UPI0040688F8C
MQAKLCTILQNVYIVSYQRCMHVCQETQEQCYNSIQRTVKDCHLKLVRLMELSVFLRLWLCYASKTLHNPTKRLYRFLSTLYACLSRSARAVLQFYPENGEQLLLREDGAEQHQAKILAERTPPCPRFLIVVFPWDLGQMPRRGLGSLARRRVHESFPLQSEDSQEDSVGSRRKADVEEVHTWKEAFLD